MIRQFVITFLLLTFISACSQNTKEISNTGNHKNDTSNVNQEETKGPLITFITDYKIIDTVVQGTNLTYAYEFTNTGSEVLFITNVRTSCSCTVASYPKTPIIMGESDNVVVKLDTKIPGQFIKTIAIYSNALNHFADDISKSRVILKIEWIVVEEIGENSKKPE